MSRFEVSCQTPFGPHLVAEFDSERDALFAASERNAYSIARYTVTERKETPRMDRMTMNDRMDALMNPAPRGLDDSDRNIMADLAGEGDEPCCFCGEPVRPSLRGGLSNIVEYWEFTADDDGEVPCHEECYDEAKEAAEMARAEERYNDLGLGRGPGR